MAQQPGSISTVDIIYAVGTNLSFLKSAEDRGVDFNEDGKVKHRASRKNKGVFCSEPASGCRRDYFDENYNALPFTNYLTSSSEGRREKVMPRNSTYLSF